MFIKIFISAVMHILFVRISLVPFNNPAGKIFSIYFVEEGLVFRPEDYIYSSARDYSGEHGLPDHVIVVGLY